jgi:hypothetical protein
VSTLRHSALLAEIDAGGGPSGTTVVVVPAIALALGDKAGIFADTLVMVSPIPALALGASLGAGPDVELRPNAALALALSPPASPGQAISVPAGLGIAYMSPPPQQAVGIRPPPALASAFGAPPVPASVLRVDVVALAQAVSLAHQLGGDMARLVLTPTIITRLGANPGSEVAPALAVDGLQYTGEANMFFQVRNNGATPETVTVYIPGEVDTGIENPERIFTVDPGEIEFRGVFPQLYHQPGSTDIYIDVTSTDLKFILYKLQ